MVANEVLSAVILLTFVGLTIIGATTTLVRVARYRRQGIRPPVLLGRDRDLLLGLVFPIGVISFVRAFELQSRVLTDTGAPEVWYLLLTGLPPIYAMARYCYFELAVIEKNRDTKRPGA